MLSDSEAHRNCCNIAVIPAKAGIQALNGFARLARELKTYLWVADPRQVAFLCLPKEKRPKERAPRMARNLPALLAGIGARLNSPGACTRGAPIRGAPVRRHGSPPDFHEYSASPSGSNTVSLDYSRWVCGTRRVLRGGLAKPFQGLA